MKIFLSHNMTGLSESEVMKIRNSAIKLLTEKYGNDIEIIDNYHHYNAPKNAGRLWHLGTSISQLDEADAIYFCEGNSDSNGCLIELLIAKFYNLRILNSEMVKMIKHEYIDTDMIKNKPKFTPLNPILNIDKCVCDPAKQQVDIEKLKADPNMTDAFTYTRNAYLNYLDQLPKNVPDDLMDADQYESLSGDACNRFLELNKKYSEPKYKCPKCAVGGMCRDNQKVLTSYPPKYKYVCNACGNVEYKYI